MLWTSALLACDEPPRTMELVDPSRWQELSAEEDPFPDRPEQVECPPSAWTIEADGALEVDTGLCDYLALGQPSLAPIRAGDLVRVQAGHFELSADSGGASTEGHFALQIGDWLAWELLQPIPSEAALYDERIEGPSELPEGTPVVLHLHNHGENTWQLRELSVKESE